MKVLFDHPNPFMLAHGGFQIQIEETKKALEAIGVEVEWLRWWDPAQRGDLIHFFGIPQLSYLRQARSKKIPVVLTHLLTSQCNRSDAKLALQGTAVKALQSLPGGRTLGNRFGWESLQEADGIIVGLECEKLALKSIFGIDDKNIYLLPLGLHDAFLENDRSVPEKKDYLICSGTITERKRSIELAEMALLSEIPILFVGKPYSECAPYWQRFEQLIDQKTVMYKSHIESPYDMARKLRSAKGFVLFSWYENWCLSAHEAAACGLPLCVPDQKWSRERFGNEATYLLPKSSPENLRRLVDFYSRAGELKPPSIGNLNWQSVAAQLLRTYHDICEKSS